jgi:hypothetical protein
MTSAFALSSLPGLNRFTSPRTSFRFHRNGPKRSAVPPFLLLDVTAYV